MTTYSVEPDHDGDVYLWRLAGTEDDPRPIPIGLQPPDRLGNKSEEWRDAMTVFRAAAAVLAPDEAVVEQVARAIWDSPVDGGDLDGLLTWEQAHNDDRASYRALARAALDALRDRAVAL